MDMADTPFTSESNGVRMGVITAVALIVYTGIAALAGFLDKIEAGALDLIILAVGVVMAIKRLKASRQNRLGYMQGFGTGIITALTASVILAAFVWLLGGVSQGVMARCSAFRPATCLATTWGSSSAGWASSCWAP